ncbi:MULTISPECIES: SDR family oxidoreductase [unclassified Shewanella]|uniref:SDR family oxidoreductase n=1 Tax=unclassified Shewanella TaxID=196818 RepID=UPI000B3411F4|nr:MULTISPECIES: SDR family oxidoreductase [unclassified Shewanella]MDH0448202.1 SDR family oxidoreductase [Shewanella sp. GD04112]MDH1469929.1 SDR family oxidoreductase [Shewanella sp. GD03713]QXN23569.1 SDR family oxidoreductase [Shewanella putrefaciens]
MELSVADQKSVAVVGCGWFGFALAKHLVQAGYRVTGAKRRTEELAPLSEAGIHGFQLQLGDDADVLPDAQALKDFFQTDFLVVNIPPRLKHGNTAYLQELQQLIALTQGWHYQGIVFISTTGVYPSLDQSMTEADAQAESASSQVLLDAEDLFARQPNSCIVRFAGLVGPKRHPGRFFAGKTDVAGGNVAVNLVHLQDCVAAVSLIIDAKAKGEKVAAVYNLCAPEHPSRSEFYVAAAESLGLAAPQFNGQLQPSKIILGDAIVRELGFEYQFASPLAMLVAC